MVFVFLSFWLLAATNTLFYENTFGRCLDLFLTRDSYDPDTPGSGFTDWYETACRRHRYKIACAWRVFHWACWSGASFIISWCIIIVDRCCTKFSKRQPSITDAIEYLDRTGKYPPWLVKAQAPAPEPKPKRETRYCHLSDEVIFVCGHGGGFEWVINGDFEAAIARRRGLSKKSA
jgi:hypothetical protein